MSLARKAATGAAWSIVASVGTRALGLVGMMVLVRYLVPAEYGVVTAAVAVAAIVNQVLSINLGMYITSNPKSSDAVLFHSTVLSIGTGMAACAVTLVAGERLGPLFGAPGMGRYLPGLALAALIDRVSLVPDRVLLSALRFRTSAMARAAGEVTFTVGSVGLAMAGHGPISIVWAGIARSLVRSAIIHGAAPWQRCYRPQRLDFGILRTLATYGTVVNTGVIAQLAATRVDNLLVSTLYGTEALAYYNLAYNLAEVPSAVVGEQISDVLSVTYSQMAADRRIAALVRSLGVLAVVVFPLAIGLGAVAPTLVAAFLKPNWRPAGTMLMVLAGLSIAKPLIGACSASLFSQGRQRTFAQLMVVSLVLVVLSIGAVGRLGPLWICVAVVLSYLTTALIGLFLIVQGQGVGQGVGMRSVVAQIAPPLLGCVPMVLAVLVAQAGSRHVLLAPRLSLLPEIAIGGVAYVASCLLVARDASRDLLRLVRQTLMRRRGDDVDVAVAETPTGTPTGT